MNTLRNLIALFSCLWAPLAIGATGSWNGIAFTAWNGIAQTSWNGTAVSCGGGAFSPSDISGLKVWLKADALALSNNDPVGSWTDSSGLGNQFTQGTAGAKPAFKTGILNSKAVVRFDGTDDVLTKTALGLTAVTLFVVFVPNSDTEYNLFETDAGLAVYWRYPGDGDGYFGTFRASRIDHYPSAMPSTGTTLISLVSGSTTYQIYKNGVGAGAQAAAFQDGNMSIGGYVAGGRYINGDVAEVILYDSELNSTQIGQVETYLRSAARWNF